MELTKSASVYSVTIGDTITYSINWTNDSNATVTINIWDTISSAITYQGCDNACSVAGSVVSWSLAGKTAGSWGIVKFWGVVSAYPWLPVEPMGQGPVYAWRWRWEELWDKNHGGTSWN